MKPYQAEWDALRAYEKTIEARFPNPYGKDNYEFERAKKADPEHQRLQTAFIEARAKAEAAAKAARAK